MLSISKKWLLTVPVVAVISACSATLPVSGQLTDGSETFTGTAEAGMTANAPFSMMSSKGASCAGSFTLATLTKGQGEFTCDDGRNGLFDFATSGGKIVGTGTISGAPITLTFG